MHPMCLVVKVFMCLFVYARLFSCKTSMHVGGCDSDLNE